MITGQAIKDTGYLILHEGRLKGIPYEADLSPYWEDLIDRAKFSEDNKWYI
jgi:hypothetical protein